MAELLHANVTDRAWRAYYTVYNLHGHDYPEAFYQEMMRLEFEALGVAYATQVEYTVTYRGVTVGKHITDTELAGCVVLEYKAQPALLPGHQAQLISYLKVSGKQVGLLLNFGSPKPEGIRRVYTGQEEKPPPEWSPGPPDSKLLYPDLTLAIRQRMYQVYRALGAGFLHRVYANGAWVELQKEGIACRRMRKLDVVHRGRLIGVRSFPHLIVEDKIVLAPVSVGQVQASQLNKVRAVMRHHGLRLGMVVNFQNEKLETRYVR